MQPLQYLIPFGPIEAAEPYIAYVALVLVLANLATRMQAHRVQKRQAEEGGADAITRYLPHVATNVLLILVSFWFLLIQPHGGTVLSVLVLSMFIADFFEFESRKVEARNDLEFERPKSAVAASVLVLLYAGFQSVFFVVEPLWNAIV